ncbi:hypothetical protein EK904_000040 [Melospiza melodia maxima]|nr:hypothetical protein EK904_000040 [Melospiza melodia maxima]
MASSRRLSGAPLGQFRPPKGITHLPSRLVGPIDGTVLHSIETVVIEWFQLVEEIFVQDPAQQLQEGLHPLPKVEFDFWQTRVTSLQCISEQLVTPQVTGLAKALEKADSCYWPSLQNMIRAVNGGLEEANDVNLHLQPLQGLLEDMEQMEYPELRPLVPKVLCTICLLRAHCVHYHSPAHIARILQETCNFFISLTYKYLNPEDMMKGLQGEPQETLEGLKHAISIIEKFFQSYSTYCSELTGTFFPGWCRNSDPAHQRRADSPSPLPPRSRRSSGSFPRRRSLGGWMPSCTGSGPSRFPEPPRQDGHTPAMPPLWGCSSALLGCAGAAAPAPAGWHRGARYTGLCACQELFQAAIEFQKLEKTVLGGVRGNFLGTWVLRISEEICEATKAFADCKYDPLDPDEEEWNTDFAEFQKKVEDANKQLAAIFCQGFDDCNRLTAAVKLVHMFAAVLERPLIKAEASPCYLALLGMFEAELESVKMLYDTRFLTPPPPGGGPAIHKNMPPVAGKLNPAPGHAGPQQQRLPRVPCW